MKAIQYKRPDDNSNIDDGALQKAFGGQIEYIGGSWCRSRVAILRANGQEIYIRYGDSRWYQLYRTPCTNTPLYELPSQIIYGGRRG